MVRVRGSWFQWEAAAAASGGGAVLLCALVACGDAGGQGVDADAARMLTAVEDLRIGSVDDPDAGFTRIAGVRVAADGRVFVLEQREMQIRVYDAQGRRVRVIGGEGEGPGEFRYPSSLGLRNDTIWVVDNLNRRLTLFDLDGRVLATIPAGGALVWGNTVRVVPSEPLGNGRYASRLSVPSPGTSPQDSLRVPALVFDSTGAVVDTAGTHFFPATPVIQAVVRNMGTLLPTPLYDHPLIIPIGGDTITVDRTAPTTGDPAFFTVTRTSRGDRSCQTGDSRCVRFSTSIRYRPRAVVTDTIVALTVRRNPQHPATPDEIGAAVREVLPAIPLHPPVARHVVGPDGTLWLQREEIGGDSLRWLILRGDGTVQGQVFLPRDDRVMWVADGVAWLVVTDSLDVPWLVRVRLEG
jgi:hypothetical protein